MNSDIERIIALQRIDSTAQEAQRRLADEPERERALEARLEVARQAVARTKEALAGNQSARRGIEKDLAIVQGRLSKFRDQLMSVKTNREYQAMQHEIEIAQTEVREMEGRILERMVEADELTAAVKAADAALATEQKAGDADRRAIAAEFVELKASLEALAAERAELVRAVDPKVLNVFELVARRRSGVAVAEARDGICTICHVRLRPQVFNTVRRNDQIVQCDSCNRILYFVQAPSPDGVNQPAP